MSNMVAITGGEGFIGSHLVERLVVEGYRVRAMVQYNSFASWGWLETLDDEVMRSVEVVLSDVRDGTAVRSFMEDAHTVYHLAALIAIPYSYEAPLSYIETNVVGTANVLQAARELETPRVVHTSTSEVYGTALTVPIDEHHPLQGQSPYSASKIGADKLAESYFLSFGLPVATLRPFNTFGPRQSARAVIPTVVAQIAAGKRRILLGSLDPRRDFTFALDTAEAFLALGTAESDLVVGSVLNAGTGRDVSIRELVHTIASVMDTQVEVDLDPARVRPPGSEVMRLQADATEIHRRTGWKPRHTLEAGLAITAEWFQNRDNLARYKPDQYNV